MLIIVNKHFMLNVVMLKIIMLSVVAPSLTHKYQANLKKITLSLQTKQKINILSHKACEL
jgi:hypothetical protein